MILRPRKYHTNVFFLPFWPFHLRQFLLFSFWIFALDCNEFHDAHDASECEEFMRLYDII